MVINNNNSLNNLPSLQKWNSDRKRQKAASFGGYTGQRPLITDGPSTFSEGQRFGAVESVVGEPRGPLRKFQHLNSSKKISKKKKN